MPDPSMLLPPGKACGDCAHLARCRMLFGCKPTSTTCDWAPSRFHEALREGPIHKGGQNVTYQSLELRPPDPPPMRIRPVAYSFTNDTHGGACHPDCPCWSTRHA
jgi:hypothetical protein